jgi:SAM-dependent methyltransferase
MSFDVPADAYLRFMGRYSKPLAEQYVDLVGVGAGDRVLDVGCGPGVLTEPLVERCGADSVAAVDPSPSFVDAMRVRFPGLDVRGGTAEELPYPDDSFDAALAQLVVHFMQDPVAGLREMGRVTRAGGVVSASVWDHGTSGPIEMFWQAAHDLDPTVEDEGHLPGSREGHLAELAAEAGLEDVRSTSLTVRVAFTSFDEWWTPYLLGVGPAGAYVASLTDEQRARLEQRCREVLPSGAFEQEATAWVVVARAGAS